MSFRDVTKEIGTRFLEERKQPLKDNALARTIRKTWPSELGKLVSTDTLLSYKVDSSPGAGAWNGAPWLAVLHQKITSSAQEGFYPVYLFEPGFKTVCLVMGQGAFKLQRAIGKKASLEELGVRAELIRRHTPAKMRTGFVNGPFATLREASRRSSSDADKDPWSVSVAYGRRYEIDTLPDDSELAADLVKMLAIYDRLVKITALDFAHTDDALDSLSSEGEMPSGQIDGATRVIQHKRIERTRNKKLVADVKKALGYKCLACDFKFGDFYGNHMSDFVEAHHLVPLSMLPDAGKVLKPTAADFIVLCSNCHKAIHAAGCPSLEKFKASLRRKLQIVGPVPLLPQGT